MRTILLLLGCADSAPPQSAYDDALGLGLDPCVSWEAEAETIEPGGQYLQELAICYRLGDNSDIVNSHAIDPNQPFTVAFVSAWSDWDECTAAESAAVSAFVGEVLVVCGDHNPTQYVYLQGFGCKHEDCNDDDTL